MVWPKSETTPVESSVVTAPLYREEDITSIFIIFVFKPKYGLKIEI
jgi:hypothetical protein